MPATSAARVAAALCTIVGITAATAVETGDAERGESVFRRACAVCHTVVAGYHKDGPSLHGVFGRPAGSMPFYTRYRGVDDLGVVWDEETLDRWLADPRAFLGGRDTTMTFKLADPDDRADVIAYLKTIR